MNKEMRLYYLFSDYYINDLGDNEPTLFSKEWEDHIIHLIETDSEAGEIYTLRGFQEAFNTEMISDQGWIIFREVETNE